MNVESLNEGQPESQRTTQDDKSFDGVLARHGVAPLRRGQVTTLQVNVGKLCNMACHHCHVEAGPKRKEIMPEAVADRILELIEHNPAIELVDLTGGAPELNPSFRHLVSEARRLGRQVIDRCNLTVLFEPGQEHTAEFLAEHQVQVVASLPCYSAENVEKQRGKGAFDKSTRALVMLNELGYGEDPALKLDLVYNPVGAFLPPPQQRLQAKYKEELSRLFGIRFNGLLTITNMPIKRFADSLRRSGEEEKYQGLLVNHFNPSTVPGLMCRSVLSIGWDGKLFDCDFNQMLELELGASTETGAKTIWDVDSLDDFAGQRIATGRHCFGCTAGAGSSCSGALT